MSFFWLSFRDRGTADRVVRVGTPDYCKVLRERDYEACVHMVGMPQARRALHEAVKTALQEPRHVGADAADHWGQWPATLATPAELAQPALLHSRICVPYTAQLQYGDHVCRELEARVRAAGTTAGAMAVHQTK